MPISEACQEELLSPAEIARFHAEGFVSIPAITTSDETERLRGIFGRLFSSRAGWEKGAQFDLAGLDEDGAPRLPQILNPVEFAPELQDLLFRRQALSVARQLLGSQAQPWFEHAIMKPAGRGGATPWHQDEAHRNDPNVEYDQVSIWMPLQAATLENGCMRYVPQSHLGPILDHHSPGDDPRIMALECIGAFDDTQLVTCPLPAGGAVIHHGRTLHSAGPNSSTIPRMAYVLAFRGPFRTTGFSGFSWNREKRTAAQARSREWSNRGGILGRSARRAGATARRLLTGLRRRLGRD